MLLVVLAREIRQERKGRKERRKENKRIQIGKVEVKLSLFADDIIFFI